MTLRLRLLLLLVGIVAAGLVISDVVTYNALRSFLTTRVDQQLEVAAFPVGRALLSSSGLGPEVPAAPPQGLGFTPPKGTTKPGAASTASGARHSGTFRHGGGLLGPSPNPQRGVLIPPGTFGELRSASGKVEAHVFFMYGGKAPTAPVIPTELPGSGLASTSDLYFSTTSTGSGGQSYRAVAKPLADRRGVVIVALPLTDVDSTLRQLLLIELVVSGLVLLGLGALSWVMVRRDLRPLEEMTETAGAIAGGDLTLRVSPVAVGTEVGRLGMAFNTMIDEIEVAFAARAASEDRLRRFLADASHELRTPLTSILGYAELFDLGMRNRPGDLATSMHHIKDEASRMGTLIDDLFLLAQLDRERPLHMGSVDLASLAERSVEGLGVRAPTRSVTVDAAGPVVVEGDEHRLRQVVDNLLVNAVSHTASGDAIELTVSGAGEWAVLTVHDEGPGIDPAEVTRIFEPFYRSDPSRTRASGGAGLGLAIVAAIVTAHQGTVTVLPGRGATFEVRIPRQRERSESAGPPGGGSGGNVPDRPLDDLSGADAGGADVEPLG